MSLSLEHLEKDQKSYSDILNNFKYTDLAQLIMESDDTCLSRSITQKLAYEFANEMKK